MTGWLDDCESLDCLFLFVWADFVKLPQKQRKNKWLPVALFAWLWAVFIVCKKYFWMTGWPRVAWLAVLVCLSRFCWVACRFVWMTACHFCLFCIFGDCAFGDCAFGNSIFFVSEIKALVKQCMVSGFLSVRTVLMYGMQSGCCIGLITAMFKLHAVCVVYKYSQNVDLQKKDRSGTNLRVSARRSSVEMQWRKFVSSLVNFFLSLSCSSSKSSSFIQKYLKNSSFSVPAVLLKSDIRWWYSLYRSRDLLITLTHCVRQCFVFFFSFFFFCMFFFKSTKQHTGWQLSVQQ